jgi:hypothetical protein
MVMTDQERAALIEQLRGRDGDFFNRGGVYVHRPVDLLEAAALEIESLSLQVKEGRAALERLGSMEAFEGSRCVTKHDDELIARIDFARSALLPKG